MDKFSVFGLFWLSRVVITFLELWRGQPVDLCLFSWCFYHAHPCIQRYMSGRPRAPTHTRTHTKKGYLLSKHNGILSQHIYIYIFLVIAVFIITVVLCDYRPEWENHKVTEVMECAVFCYEGLLSSDAIALLDSVGKDGPNNEWTERWMSDKQQEWMVDRTIPHGSIVYRTPFYELYSADFVEWMNSRAWVRTRLATSAGIS